MGVILFVVVAGIFNVEVDNWSPFLPMGWSGVFKGAGPVVFSYIGFDAVATASEEVKDAKSLPRGIVGNHILPW